MNLAQDFALLAYDNDSKPRLDDSSLDHGLGGALLLELVLAGKVDIEDKRVVVRDGGPTGDSLADVALRQIAEDGVARKPGHWVGKFAKNARGQVMERLAAEGVVRKEQHKVLGVFPRTRYTAANGVEPAPAAEAEARLRAAMTTSGAVEPRTAALCALVAATGLDKKMFKDLDRKQVKARLRDIGDRDWAAVAVKKTIEEIQAAIMVSVIAAAVVVAG